MSTTCAARVVSAIPGRTRIRLYGRHRTDEEIRRLSEALSAHAGVVAVQVRPRASSLVIHYDPATTDLEELLEAMHQLDLPVAGQRQEQARQDEDAAKRLLATADRLDRRVARTTGGLDLRFLAPAGLAALSVRQARRGPRLKDAPWYVLGWYAFNAFLELNERGRRAEPPIGPEGGDNPG